MRRSGRGDIGRKSWAELGCAQKAFILSPLLGAALPLFSPGMARTQPRLATAMAVFIGVAREERRPSCGFFLLSLFVDRGCWLQLACRCESKCVQVTVRLRRREPRCRKRQPASRGSRNEADGRANRSSLARLRDRGRFRLHFVASPNDGAPSARTAAGRAAAHDEGGACRRLVLASGAALVAQPRPGRAPGGPSEPLRPRSPVSDIDAHFPWVLAAG